MVTITEHSEPVRLRGIGILGEKLAEAQFKG
jgi:hypothetical protein